MLKTINKLKNYESVTKQELIELISCHDSEVLKQLSEAACMVREKYYGDKIFVRGLLEFSNYCKNDCYYCGIGKSIKTDRYRLSENEILESCQTGYDLGVRTFVLQSGEDLYYTDEKIVSIVSKIKQRFADCAITLSMGEKSYESYQKYYDAGADRYLLRHETATDVQYTKLHPGKMSLESRKQCLYDLKKIGYSVGAGFMVGSPFQTAEHLANDLLFLQKLDPHMVGIGPFIPHEKTVFAHEKAGTLEQTLLMLALIRLLLPKALIPSTTALGTIDPLGREKGFNAGANVVMINITPIGEKAKYMLYDNKICVNEGSGECRFCIERRINSVGLQFAISRGDYFKENEYEKNSN